MRNVSVLLGFLLILSLPPPLHSSLITSHDGLLQNSSRVYLNAPFTSPFPSFSGYVDPELFEAEGPVRVIVIVDRPQDIDEIAVEMISSRVAPPIGGLTMIGGLIDAERIEKLAENKHVVALMRDRKVSYYDSVGFPQISNEFNPSSLKDLFKHNFRSMNDPLNNNPGATLKEVTQAIGANEAWDTYNITGENITIAIIDTGVDYGAISFAYWDVVARDVEGNPACVDIDGMGLALTEIALTAFENETGTFIPTAGIDPVIYLPLPIYPSPKVLPFSLLFGTPWFSDMDVTGIVSGGEEVHFGLMFQWLFGTDILPILVVKSTGETYDTVYVDLSYDWSWIPYTYRLQTGREWPFWSAPWPPDFSFSDETPITPEGWTVAARDFTGDGVPDLSAGSLGYLLDTWAMAPNPEDRGKILEPVDPSGNYVCFVNDWDGHGTSCASSAAGREYNNLLIGSGVAPSSKIMGVVAGWVWNVIEGELWAAGFDLIPGSEGWNFTPGYGSTYGTWNYTGFHKADIISNSWGFEMWAPTLMGLPWYDVVSMLEDALTIPGYLAPDYPGTVVIHAGGNGGAGYGTFTPPSYAALTIGVGASTALNLSKRMFGFAGGYSDEIISWSSRGPTPLGYVKPDVVNVGAWGFVSRPLWEGLGDGSSAVEVFGGTSLSTPLTAGVASLIVQAYSQTYGVKPTPELTKIIMKSTSKDLGYDAFNQGSGRVDALSAVEVALREKGVTISSPATWANVRPRLEQMWSTSSTYFYETLPLRPPPKPIRDVSWFAGFIRPRGTTNATFTISNPGTSDSMATIETVTYEVIEPFLTFEGSTDSMPPDWDASGWQFGNLTLLEGEIIPEDADLMTVALTVPYEYFDSDGDYTWDRRWGLCIIDWNDTNTDGEINVDEVYNVNYGYNAGTSNEVRVGFPGSKFRFKPALFVYQIENESVDPITVPFTIHMRFFKRTPWKWVETPESVNVPANTSQVFGVTMNIPPNATQGVHEGFLMISFSGISNRTTAIPVSVNVPAIIPEESLTYELTPSPSTDLYDSHSLDGLFDWNGWYESGDWKTWVIQIEDPAVVATFISCNWTGEMTDVDMYVINPNGVMMGGTVSPDLNGGIVKWWTETNATSELVASYTQNPVGSPTPGVYTVLLHNVLFNGTIYPENVTGRVELVKIVPRGPETMSIKPGGSASLNFTLSTGRTLNNVTISPNPYTQFTANVTPTLITEIKAMESQNFTIEINVPVGTPAGKYPVLTGVFIGELVGPPMYMPAMLFIDVLSDVEPPEVNVVSPIEGEILRGVMEIKVYAVDEADWVELAEYSIDDEKSISMSLNRETGLWTARRDTTEIIDGTYEVSINVSDRAGNSIVETIPFTIDNTKPEGEITLSQFVKGTETIALRGDDINFEKMELYINGAFMEAWTESGNQTYNWDTTELRDGTYLFRLIVQDKAGNIAVRDVNAVIDNTRPQAEVREPQGGYISRVILLILEGHDVNLDKMALYVDETMVGEWADGGKKKFELNTTTLEDGDHIIKLKVVDMAGSVEENSVRVTVDNLAPSVTIEAPEDGAVLEGTTTIKFTVSDINLRNFTLYIDGAPTKSWMSSGTYAYEWNTTAFGDGSHELKVEAYDKSFNRAETSVTVKLINIKRSMEATRNLYLAIGIPLGLAFGAAVTWAIKRRSSP